jgi:hypothetical protein
LNNNKSKKILKKTSMLNGEKKREKKKKKKKKKGGRGEKELHRWKVVGSEFKNETKDGVSLVVIVV